MDRVRTQIKFEVFEGRRAPGQRYCVCELCKKAPATDLHEIINRAHAPVEVVQQHPELLSALCNTCNLGAGDSKKACLILLRANVARYGWSGVKQAVEVVQQKTSRTRLFLFTEFMSILKSEQN